MKVENVIIGFIPDIITTGVTVWIIMPSLMLTERVSSYGIEATVAK